MDEPNPTRGAPGRWRAIRGPVIAALITAVALTALYAGVQYFGATQSSVAGICGALSLERRGLPCDIPLPAGARFDSTNVVAGTDGVAEYDWTFTVLGHWEYVLDFYQRAFYSRGWPCAVVTRVEGVYVTASGKSDRHGEVAVLSFLVGGATSTQIEIGILPHPNLPPFLTCRRPAEVDPGFARHASSM